MTRETEIIRRIRQGDEGQFESLFRSSYVSLVQYAKRLVRDHDTAEEIVQDFFAMQLGRMKEEIGGRNWRRMSQKDFRKGLYDRVDDKWKHDKINPLWARVILRDAAERWQQELSA